jgi:hypothetical protein
MPSIGDILHNVGYHCGTCGTVASYTNPYGVVLSNTREPVIAVWQCCNQEFTLRGDGYVEVKEMSYAIASGKKKLKEAWDNWSNTQVQSDPSQDQRVVELNGKVALLEEQIEELKKSESVRHMKELEEKAIEAEQERHEKVELMRHLEEALKPMILRLKVLDLDAISEEDMELVPLRFLLSELKRLVQAYDEVEKGIPLPRWDDPQMTSTISQPYGYAGYAGGKVFYTSNDGSWQTGNCAKCGADQWCYCTV